MDSFDTDIGTGAHGVAGAVAPRDLSSASLARLAANGDRVAIGELYRRAWPRALAAVRAACGVDESEDAVAEAFTTALTRMDQVRDPVAVEAWLTKAAIRASIRQCRRRSRVRPSGAPSELPSDHRHVHESAADRVETAFDCGMVTATVRALPADLRAVVQLRYLQELPAREVARRLDLPEGTVRRRCFDARRLMRRRLLRAHVVPAIAADSRRHGAHHAAN